MGWYILNKEISIRSQITIYICGVLGYLATVVCMQLFYDNIKSLVNFYTEYNSLTVFLYSITVFTFLHSLLKRKNFMTSAVLLKIQVSYLVFI